MRPPRFTRRRLLAAGGLSLLGGAVLDPSWTAGAASDAAVDGWPMERRDPARTGFDPDGTAPRGEFSVRWRATVPEPSYRTRPLAVVDGNVYAVGEDELVAVAADSGETRWRFDGESRPWREYVGFTSSPAAFDGGVVVASQTDVLGFAAASGRLDWSYDETTNVETPLLVGNTVYCEASGDGTLVLDAETGLSRRRSPLSTDFEPFAYREGVLVGRGDSPDKLVAVDAATGDRLWTETFAIASAFFLSPSLGRETVYYGTGPLYAISLADGSVRWEGDLGASRAGTRPVTDGDRVYVVAADEETRFVVAFDAETGERVWRADANAADEAVPAVVDDTLYVTTPTGFVALDAADGGEVGRFRPTRRRGSTRSPVVVDGTVYVALDDTLYAVEGSA
ncbi:outer membrane protein assembly factor BamB family protein [Halogeometricum limi]|uniref:WD-40 repeat-containing protein n=1 Tax=Halogeometricum limi TaxID=555875 RepID=A0A1I6FSF4_9EURY|nr:PQQ-binding-like beta-propeller repeat protein [Halogeometricum limi]SFR32828.1 WD-40 repeat-containing protein [Halogeometricum limi]